MSKDYPIIRKSPVPTALEIGTSTGNFDNILSAGDTNMQAALDTIDDMLLGDISDVTLTTPSSGQVLSFDGTDWVNTTPSTGGTPGGSDTQIQYNNAGSFGGSSTLAFNGTNTITFDAGGLVNTVLAINGSTNHSIISTATDELKFRDTTAGVDRLQIESNGVISTDTVTYETLVTGDNDIPNKKYVDDAVTNNLEKVSAPSTSSETGTNNQIAWDADYIYVCTATNTWKRVGISTW